MRDYENIAKTAFINGKEQGEFAERIRNKYRNVIDAAKDEFPPVYLRNRVDFKKLKKEVDEYVEKDFFGPTIYKLMQAVEQVEEMPLKKLLLDMRIFLRQMANKMHYRKKVKSLIKEIKIKEDKGLKQYKRMYLEYIFTNKINRIPKKFFGHVLPVTIPLDGENDTFLIAVISPASNIDEMTKRIKEAYFETFYKGNRQRLKVSKNDDIAMYLIRKKKEGIKYDIAIGQYACEYPEEFPDPDSVEFDEELDYLNKNASSIVHQFRKSLPKLD